MRAGSGPHRVRSSRSHAAWRYGSGWVGLADPVRFPVRRPRPALPMAPSRSPDLARVGGSPHETPARHMYRPLRRLVIRFVFAGDCGFGTCMAARYCRRHRGLLTGVVQDDLAQPDDWDGNKIHFEEDRAFRMKPVEAPRQSLGPTS